MVLEIVISVGFLPIFLIYQIGEISIEYVEIESILRTYSSENLHPRQVYFKDSENRWFSWSFINVMPLPEYLILHILHVK